MNDDILQYKLYYMNKKRVSYAFLEVCRPEIISKGFRYFSFGYI